MNLGQLLNKKKFAPKDYKAIPLEVNCDFYKGTPRGYATTLEYFTCNFRNCYEPAIKRTSEGFYCSKHLKEDK